MKNSRNKRFFLFLGLITLAGVAVRLIVSAQLIRADSFVFAPPAATDMATYLAVSGNVISGNIPSVFYYQPFYYTVFLPLCRILFQTDVWSAALGQTICGGLIIYLSGLCGAMLRGRRAGLISAFFAAFSLGLILYVPYALLEIQQCLWMTLLFYLTLRCLKKNTEFLWGCTGVILAFAILSRGNAWCFLPAVLLALFWRYKHSLRTGRNPMLRRLAVLGICVILPQLPFAIRNTDTNGYLCGPSTAGGAVLALGNTPEASPRGLDYPESYNFWMEHQDERSVLGRMCNFFLTEPAAFLELQLRKFMYFWDSEDVPNNISIEYNGSKSGFLKHVPLISSGLLLMFFLAGVFLTLRSVFRKRGILLLDLFVLLYALAAASFYILARFRVPVFGLLAIGAGLAFQELFCRIRKKDKKKIFFAGTAVFMAFFLVYLLCPVYSAVHLPRIMQFCRPDGAKLIRSADQCDVFDYGPRCFGGWSETEIRNGTELVKRFVIPEGFENASAQLTLYFGFQGIPSPVRLEINGNPVQITPLENERFQEYTTSPVQCPADGVFHLLFTETAPYPVPRPVLYLDVQRDYGRTQLDGKVIPAEAALRLRLLKTQ